MRKIAVYQLFPLLAGLAAAGGCGDVEVNGSHRPGLSREVGVYDADIAPQSMAGDALEPGLWVTIRNDLPVIRQDGQVISQAFLEAEVVAWDEHELQDQATSEGSGGQAVGAEHEGSARREPISGLRYALRGRVLSESETSFWLSPQQLDDLVQKSGGRLGFSIKDSVQYSSYPFPCWMDDGRALQVVKSSSEARVQQLTLRVEGRYSLTYKCRLESAS